MPGNYTYKDLNITYVQEAQNLHGASPLIKYDPVEIYKIKKKPRYTKIEEKVQRFPSFEKSDSPSIASYDV